MYRNRRRNIKFFIACILICALSAVICFAAGVAIGVVYPKMTQIVTEKEAKNSEKNMLRELSNLKTKLENGDISGETYLIKKTEPSVVDLKIRKQEIDFFNMGYETEESGTGIIFHKTYEKVYIVTNHHVVENASLVLASINDGDYISARLVGKDTNSNLAVLSVEKQDLGGLSNENIIVPEFGNSDDVGIGDPVIAIGSSSGEASSATKGVVSAINKKVRILNRYLNVIQTDAAINPGYNGGPLISKYGEIIGINTARISTNTAIEGTGYSIASNDVKKVIEQIMNNEGAPFLGIHMSDISEEIASSYNIPQLGVFVIDVVEGSSADIAGIMPKDIITGFNGRPVFSTQQLVDEIRECSVSEEVSIKVIRHGKEPLTIKVVLMANKDTSF